MHHQFIVNIYAALGVVLMLKNIVAPIIFTECLSFLKIILSLRYIHILVKESNLEDADAADTDWTLS